MESAALILLAAAAILLLLALDRRRAVRPSRIYARLAPWAPTALGVLTGIALLAAALERTLLAPNLLLPDGVLGTLLVVVELVGGLLLILGFFVRLAAAGLLALTVSAFFLFGREALDYLNFAGIAIFLLAFGRGRLSLGSVMGKIFLAVQSSHLYPGALAALRGFTAFGPIILGAGKFIRPDLHLELVRLHAGWNPYDLIHPFLPFLTTDWYVFLLALGEVSAGTLLLLGAFIRPLALILVIPFFLSPIFFGVGETLGHLPTIGALLALLILGKGR